MNSAVVNLKVWTNGGKNNSICESCKPNFNDFRQNSRFSSTIAMRARSWSEHADRVDIDRRFDAARRADGGENAAQ